MRWLVGVDDWLASYTERKNGKIELDPISTEGRLRQLFAVYGCNGTEFFNVIFTDQGNFTTAETATEERQRNDGTGRNPSAKTLSNFQQLLLLATDAREPGPREESPR